MSRSYWPLGAVLVALCVGAVLVGNSSASEPKEPPVKVNRTDQSGVPVALPLAVTKTDPKCDYECPPRVSIYDQAIEMVWVNDSIPRDWVNMFGCDQLLELKQTIYARHGYVFQSATLSAKFKDNGLYVANPNVSASTIGWYLTSSDQVSRLRITLAQSKKKCPFNLE